jgi:hypothetical protein
MLNDIEVLYTRHKPQCENTLYECFNSFLIDLISKGLTIKHIEQMYIYITEISSYQLKHSINDYAKQVGEILTLSECEDDMSYMQDLSLYGFDGCANSDNNLNKSRKPLCDS